MEQDLKSAVEAAATANAQGRSHDS